MREIKFRAWDKATKIMNEVTTLNLERSIVELKDKDGVYHIARFKDGKIKLMQFTGLQDCNGVDIYEGDIVEISQTDYKEQETYDSKSEVVFVDGAFKLVFYDLADEFYLDLKDSTIDYVEVIGNICENPELLEVENNEK